MIVLQGEIVWESADERTPANVLRAIADEMRIAHGAHCRALATGEVTEPDFLVWLSVLLANSVGLRLTPSGLMDSSVDELEAVYHYLTAS